MIQAKIIRLRRVICNKHWSSLFSAGLKNIFDNCPLVPNRKQTNKDGDSFGDECDNCPSTSNSDQVNENDFSGGVQFQISRVPSPPSFLSPLPLLLSSYLYTSASFFLHHLPPPLPFFHLLCPALPTLYLGLSFALYAYVLPTSDSPTPSSSSSSSSSFPSSFPSSSSSSSSSFYVLPPTLLSFLSYLLSRTSTSSCLTSLPLVLSYLITPISFSHPCLLSICISNQSIFHISLLE